MHETAGIGRMTLSQALARAIEGFALLLGPLAVGLFFLWIVLSLPDVIGTSMDAFEKAAAGTAAY